MHYCKLLRFFEALYCRMFSSVNSRCNGRRSRCITVTATMLCLATIAMRIAAVISPAVAEAVAPCVHRVTCAIMRLVGLLLLLEYC